MIISFWGEMIWLISKWNPKTIDAMFRVSNVWLIVFPGLECWLIESVVTDLVVTAVIDLVGYSLA